MVKHFIHETRKYFQQTRKLNAIEQIEHVERIERFEQFERIEQLNTEPELY